jgi:hypothetical protein
VLFRSVSYGRYHFSSAGKNKNESSVAEFINSNPELASEFKGLTPGSNEFGLKWKEVNSKNPNFGQQQHEFIKNKYYDVAVKRINDELGFDVNTRSRAVQEAIWSTSVQHRNTTSTILKRAFKDKGKDINKLSDEEIIKGIYQERGAKNDDGTMKYFGKNSAAVQSSVSNRFGREQQNALSMLSADPSKMGTSLTASQVGNIGPANPNTQSPFPVKGEITSNFGSRTDPFTGKTSNHKGIDIAAAKGTSVTAVKDGTVIFTGTQNGYGNIVEIQHNDGTRTKYAHLESFGVEIFVNSSFKIISNCPKNLIINQKLLIIL